MALDLVEQVLAKHNVGTRQIFQEAYRDSLDPSNWSWAHSIILPVALSNYDPTKSVPT